VEGFRATGTRQVDAWAARSLPPVERLAGDLWSVPVPIPDNPLRYTLSYLVPAVDGCVVVDPGWDTEAGWAALTAGLAAAGARVADVRGVVVTHVHPDHHGLSTRLQQAGAWVAMHPAERDTLPQRTSPGPDVDRRAAAERWLRRSGTPEPELAGLLTGFATPAGSADPLMAEPDVLLEDGDLVPTTERALRAVWTPGHTPGHLCLQVPDARLLLTGDHVLPRISPNIGLHPGADEPSLANFLASLDQVAGYDDHEALPAHEYRFRGLADRARQLQDHHAGRCQEVLDVVADLGAPTMWELAERLTWSRPWSEIGFMVFGALAETAAHVRYLADLGRLDWPCHEGSGDDAPGQPTPSAQPADPRGGKPSHSLVSGGGLGHREVGAVPPAACPVGEGRGVRGFMDMIGT
jgi:glyoxylase-like metal-dependent hydrolase (beta-lactamase superfamily II)